MNDSEYKLLIEIYWNFVTHDSIKIQALILKLNIIRACLHFFYFNNIFRFL